MHNAVNNRPGSGAADAKKYMLTPEDSETSSSDGDEPLIEVDLSQQPTRTSDLALVSSTTRTPANSPAMRSRPAEQKSSLPGSPSAHTTHPDKKTGQALTSTRPSLRAAKGAELSTEERREMVRRHQALMHASVNGLIDTIDELISQGLDIDRPDLDGYTALHHAAQHGHIRVVARLIEHGAKPQTVTPFGYTSLALAASYGQSAAVEYLLSHYQASTVPRREGAAPAKSAAGVNVYLYESAANESNAENESAKVDALFDAVVSGNLSGAARMIAAQSKKYANGSMIRRCMHVEETDQKGRSLLILACRNGDPDMAMLLLCAGASVDQTDLPGNTPLMHAVREKKAPVVAVLLKAGARVDLANTRGETALSMAIDSNDVGVLEALRKGRVDIWNSTVWNEPLIVYAAKNQKRLIVKALLEARADPPDPNGSRSLAVLAREGDATAAALLLKAGADPHHKASDGHTAFTLAAANGREASAAALLKHRATPEWKQQLQAQTDNQGRTALMLAVLNKKEEMASYLLKNQADLHQRDRAGRNALLWAAAKADARMLALLISHRATHVCADNHGNTMFIIAAANDNRDLLRAICTPFYVNSQFNINTPNKDGDSALIEAARRGLLLMVNLLLENGANVLHANRNGRTALHEAAAHGHKDVVIALQEKEARLPTVYPYANEALQMLATVPFLARVLPERVPRRTRELDRDGNSLLMLAASNGHESLLNDLFNPQAAQPEEASLEDSGDDSNSLAMTGSSSLSTVSPSLKVNIEEKNREGMNALCMATRRGHYATVELLIHNGAKCYGALVSRGAMGEDPITPLWLAARLTECAAADGGRNDANQVRQSPEMLVDLLLKNGAQADINTPSWQGQTPLIAAAGAGRPVVVKLLIDSGAVVNQGDSHKLTPLMHAAHHGHLQVVEMLLNNGALPDPKPAKLSALILAAESGRDRVVSLLAARGANVNHADTSGNTALIGAARSGNISTVKLLISLGANLQHSDNKDHTAYSYAVRAGHHEIVRALEEGAPPPRDC